MLDTRWMRWFSAPLTQTGLLLLLAGLCALLSNTMADPSRHLGWRDQPAATVSTIPTAAVSVPQPPAQSAMPARFTADPAQPIREISPADAWALYRAKAPFLDARRSSEYAEGHIAGAWNVSVWESAVEAQITQFEAAVKPSSITPLVLYCSGGECEDSHLLASRLTPLGYRNLFVYRAGYPDWVQQGRPTGKGMRP
jgi:rhodanese-related sulfurtransferase